MKPGGISFIAEGEAFYPVFRANGREGAGIAVPVPVECSYLDGSSDRLAYQEVREQPSGQFLATGTWTRYGFAFQVRDLWGQASEGHIRLERRLAVSRAAKRGVVPSGKGFQLHLAVQLASPGERWQFFAPGMLYSPGQRSTEKLVTFSDHRLAYPLVAAYHGSKGDTVCLSRVSLATYDNRAVRSAGERRYIQRTDLGSTGFSRGADGPALHLFWPYYEGEQSALLDAGGSSASAFFPLDGSTLEVTLSYELALFDSESFADAVLGSFKNAYTLADPQPPQLPFSLRDSIEYRLASLEKTYTEWDRDGAGFILNFDPEQGYESQAKAFGASFTTHDTGDSRDILEYGFTGRQLNAAYVLAEKHGGEWLERSRRVVDFFARHMAEDSGWLYATYHLGKRRPLYTVGDPDGPVMHYLARSPQPGAYTRMMVEVASDLLLNHRLHKQQGNEHTDWLDACVRFGDFLLRKQNHDGSWYRAYTPASEPIRANEWFGATEAEAKSATSVPVPYLLALADELGSRGTPYLAAAQRACGYVLLEHVALDEYRGGTLDNPNVVDKEAAMMTMSALLALYERLGERVYLDGAERAAKLAVTWNSIWNVPNVPGTRLDGAGVRSTGWGGINSTWGAGVTDIYSLFFLAEFVRLSKLTGEPIYAEVANLIAHGTQQILSHPGDLFGFTDVGMQPEGIAFCSQGEDEGQIAKGDIWGGLGWIYTAGTFGLSRYLAEKEG